MEAADVEDQITYLYKYVPPSLLTLYIDGF
jgi:hypothetical protein